MTDRPAGTQSKKTGGRTARRAGERGQPAGSTSGPAEGELPARLRVAVTRLNRRLRQESVTGISPSQESALSTINRLGEPTLGELAQAEQVQPPTMTRVVAAMQAAGLIVRHGDEDDRRVSRVELTSEGRATLERSKNLKNAYIARQIATLTSIERCRAFDLAALLEKLVEDR